MAKETHRVSRQGAKATVSSSTSKSTESPSNTSKSTSPAGKYWVREGPQHESISIFGA
jgi:hypothetical protein